MNKNILLALERNELVIVVGNDLSLVRMNKSQIPKHDDLISKMDSANEDDHSVIVNIKEYLAFVLWNEYEPSKGPPEPYNLNNVVEVLISDGTAVEDDIKAYIIGIVKELSDEQIVLDPFIKLAKISNIETILSVNFDDFLERAFEAESIKVNPSINFSIQDNNNLEDNIDKDKAIVSVFNLMGNIKDSDFAITEEAQLEYLYSLLMGKDANNKALFDAVKDKSILFIGCSFPNWFMRFFIRTISKKRFKSGRSKFVASDRASQDIDLCMFLENNKTSVIPIGNLSNSSKDSDENYKNTIEFIDELFESTEKNKLIKTDTKPRYKEKIFLSYSWGDKPLIKKLKNEFEKCGVEVFFDDDDLRNGEDFANKITKYIKDCDYIIPLISNNSISRKDSYVYEKEWRPAIMLESFGIRDSYIRPYIIDETSPTDDRIPAEIRSKNIYTIPSEDNFGEIVRKFIKENHLTETDK